MFTISLRITKRQIIAAGAAFAIAFAGGIWAKAAFTQLRGTPAQSSAVVKINKVSAKSNEQRVSFLKSFGWEVESQEEEILEVYVPKEFDDTIQSYNEIQNKQGCDLSKYAGKRCKRYTYIVKNYPNQTENIRANILTYKDKIIGGDICSLELDGFMHGFAGPNAANATNPSQNQADTGTPKQTKTKQTGTETPTDAATDIATDVATGTATDVATGTATDVSPSEKTVD